jgi:AraC family transcriptional regulator
MLIHCCARSSCESRQIVPLTLGSKIMTSVREWPLLNVAGITGASTLVVDYAPGFRQTRHVHGHSSITLVLRGAVEEENPTAIFTAKPFAVITKQAGTAHSDLYGPEGCKALQINFAPEFDFREIDLPENWSTSCISVRGRVALRDLLARNAGQSDTATACAFYEFVSALSKPLRDAGPPPKWLRRVKEMIDGAHPGTSFTLDDLRREAGVHPVHLTRQFRKWHRCSLREYLRVRRIHAAADAVATDGRPLTEVAHAFGYADQAHFSRTFRRFAFMSAGEYRRLLARLDGRNRLKTFKRSLVRSCSLSGGVREWTTE